RDHTGVQSRRLRIKRRLLASYDGCARAIEVLAAYVRPADRRISATHDDEYWHTDGACGGGCREAACRVEVRGSPGILGPIVRGGERCSEPARALSRRHREVSLIQTGRNVPRVGCCPMKGACLCVLEAGRKRMCRGGHDYPIHVRIVDGFIPHHYRSERVTNRDDPAKARAADLAMAQCLYDLMRDMRSRIHGDQTACGVWGGSCRGHRADRRRTSRYLRPRRLARTNAGPRRYGRSPSTRDCRLHRGSATVPLRRGAARATSHRALRLPSMRRADGEPAT